jgi:dUTP pyrophosphatase
MRSSAGEPPFIGGFLVSKLLGEAMSKKDEKEVLTSSRDKVTIQIVRIDESLPLPEYKTLGAAGMDLFASLDEDVNEVVLGPNSSIKINTGIKVSIPEGYYIQLYSRSGFAAKFAVTLTNSVGVIDPGYVDEIVVMLTNHGGKALTIKQGERIAQCVLCKVPEIVWDEVDEFSEDTFDRGGGLGSTGV